MQGFLRVVDPQETAKDLFICLHGGGQKQDALSAHGWDVNTREFKVQTQLAERMYPEDGIYFIPRMADDRLGRWRHGHNIELFEKVIGDAILHHNVDPNRVYMMGISQVAYGIYILAPFMADSLAGANPMTCAGDSNVLANLRNVAFRTDIGELDTTFDRIGCAKRTHEALEQLRQQDPYGFEHRIGVQNGRGHGIDYTKGQSWIAKRKRNPWPQRLRWIAQTTFGHYRPQFYWVGIPTPPLANSAWVVDAQVDRDANQVVIEISQRANGDAPSDPSALAGLNVNVFLDDSMLDLDAEISVIINSHQLYRGVVTRSSYTLKETLQASSDPGRSYPVKLRLTLPEPVRKSALNVEDDR